MRRHGPIRDGSPEALAMRDAVRRGFRRVSLAFLEGRADPDVRLTDGSTPLMWASAAGQSELVRRLIELRARVGATDQNGWTALFHAAAHQHLDACVLLVDAGADVHLRDVGGRRPVDQAAYRYFRFRTPFLGEGGGEVRTVGDTPVRRYLKRVG